MRAHGVSGIILAAGLALGCGHVTKVRPTARGAVALEATLGGPIGKVEGTPIPLPLSTVGASYGLADRFDLEAHLHLTSLVFGVGGLDVGADFLALSQNGALPALNLNGRLYGFTDLHQWRAYAELTPAVSWLLGEHFMTYVSGSALAQFAGGPVVFTVAAGEEFELSRRTGLQLEVRWYEPTALGTNLPTDWVTAGGHGALGVLLGFHTTFGGEP